MIKKTKNKEIVEKIEEPTKKGLKEYLILSLFGLILITMFILYMDIGNLLIINSFNNPYLFLEVILVSQLPAILFWLLAKYPLVFDFGISPETHQKAIKKIMITGLVITNIIFLVIIFMVIYIR